MQGKAFWVIPGPLHVPSWEKKKTGHACAHKLSVQCVCLCESFELSHEIRHFRKTK